MGLQLVIKSKIDIQRYAKLSYLLFFACAFWGPALGGIPLGSISMFPARIFALTTWALFALMLVQDRSQLTSIVHRNNSPYLFLVAWLVWGGVSLIWGIDANQGLRDLFNLFIGISLVGLAPFFLRDKKDINQAVKIWLITLGIFLVIATIENLTGLHLPISRFSSGLQSYLGYRPTVAFVNENNFATFLTFSLPFLLTFWRYFTGLRVRIITGLGIFIGAYTLLITGSRINIIALIILALVFSFLLIPWGKKLKVLTLLCLVGVGVGLFFGVAQPNVRSSLSRGLDEVVTSSQELLGTEAGAEPDGDYLVSSGSLAVRLNMVRNGVVFLGHTLGLGTGVGNFESWIKNFRVYNTGKIVNAHNWWTELSTEFGVLITLGYLVFFVSLLWIALKSWMQAQGKDRWIPEALVMIFIIFPLVAFSPSSFLNYLPQWQVLAVAFAWQQYYLRAGV